MHAISSANHRVSSVRTPRASSSSAPARFGLAVVLACSLLTARSRAQDPAPTPPAPAPNAGQDPTPPTPANGGAARTPRAGGADPSADAMKQGSPPSLPANSSREAMWPAPTAEDWKKPCLVKFQRTWEDAVAVSQETKRMILVCVNMDGEIASEHYAGIRYRQPDIAKLYEPYVCVIASVYRHTPRDYDEQGRRILCPRFGSVTCGEHIAIEPGLFDKYFEGKRIAPRHIGVELDAHETYDVYYAWDTDSVFRAVREGVAHRDVTPVTVNRSDLPLVERSSSPDATDRDAVEKAYLDGDSNARRELVRAAVARSARVPVDLLRLAVYDLDPELAAMARRALAESNSEASVDLIAEALRAPMPAAERDALLAALVRIGATSPRARSLAVVFQGLSGHESKLDLAAWSSALDGAAGTQSSRERYVLETNLENRARAAEGDPADVEARLSLAESYLSLAADPRTDRKYATLLFEDARRNALEAERAGRGGWRVNSVLCVAEYRLGRRDEGRARAEKAMADRPADAKDPTTAEVLAIFTEVRRREIGKAVREHVEWSPQLLTDLHAAYALLLKHPAGTDVQVVEHFDFLKWLGAVGEAGRVLDEGLARFKDSWLLHDRLRGRILAERGVGWLEPTYEALVREKDAPPGIWAAAGYTSLVAAEYHRRAGDFDLALKAYDHAVAHYEQYVALVPDAKSVCDHYVAIAHGGRARIAYERKDDATALQEILASFARRPESAASLDGLNISTVDTAKMLRARLQADQREDLLATLQGALDALDPAMLQLPAYERPPPGEGPQRGPRGRRNAPDGAQPQPR